MAGLLTRTGLSVRTIFSQRILASQTVRNRSTATDSSEDAEPIRPETCQAENMMDIGTRSIFTEEHDIFRRTVRKFFQEEVAPNYERWEENKMVHRDFWKVMGKAGLLGVGISEKSGGMGGDFRSTLIVGEEQAYINNPGGASFGAHSELAMPYIDVYGTKEQQEKFIPAMTAGEKIGALAMTEPAAGSDLQGVKTYAKKDGDDWILNGSKVFITNGHSADVVVVVAITDLDAKHRAHGISLFLVEEGMPGFIRGRVLKKVGLHTSDTAEMFFEDVRLPASALLGGEQRLNKGFYSLMEQLPRERLGIAVGCAAHAEFIFEETRKYVKTRKAFGKPISKLQVTQHKLANLKTEICVTRAFVDKCMEMMDNGTLDPVTASMAKAWASTMVNKVATECLQLHGGWGYMMEFPVAKAFVDARVAPIYGGTNEIMNELIARDIVKD